MRAIIPLALIAVVLTNCDSVSPQIEIFKNFVESQARQINNKQNSGWYYGPVTNDSPGSASTPSDRPQARVEIGINKK